MPRAPLFARGVLIIDAARRAPQSRARAAPSKQRQTTTLTIDTKCWTQIQELSYRATTPSGPSLSADLLISSACR